MRCKYHIFFLCYFLEIVVSTNIHDEFDVCVSQDAAQHFTLLEPIETREFFANIRNNALLTQIGGVSKLMYKSTSQK